VNIPRSLVVVVPTLVRCQQLRSGRVYANYCGIAEKQGKQGISKMERAIIKAAKEIPPDAAKSVMNLLEAIQTARSSGGFTN